MHNQGTMDGRSMGRVLRGYTRLLCFSLSDLIATIIEIMVSFLSAESVCNMRGWLVGSKGTRSEGRGFKFYVGQIEEIL